MTGTPERIAATRPDPLVVVTCEHASGALPAGWRWPEADRWLVGTHWAWDPGAAEVARGLARWFGAPAILATVTRLVVDPNRDLASETLFRTVAEGRPIAMNANLDEGERQARIERFYLPYHRVVDEVVSRHPGAAVVSVHSFTDVYEGTRREVEVGILHDRDPEIGRALRRILARDHDARDNEPWDGRGGLMYAAQHHATRHGRRAVEIEVRQDLLADPDWRARFVVRLARGLDQVLRGG